MSKKRTSSGRRKTISKTVRFEVFKRDQFTCQYCGRKAPEAFLQLRAIAETATAPEAGDGTDGVRLHIDHIDPVALGGANDVLNYVTACEDCNLGKGARPLSDDSVLTKRRRQLDEIAERREQSEMLFQWQRELGDLDAQTADRLAAYWSECAPGYVLNDNGRKSLARLRKEFQVEELMTAMRVAAETYLERAGDGRVTQASWELAWRKVGGICRTTREQQDEPYLQQLYYVRGILRNRFPDEINMRQAISLLRRAAQAGCSIEELKDEAREAWSWSRWRRNVENAIVDAAAMKKTEPSAFTPAQPKPVPPSPTPPGAGTTEEPVVPAANPFAPPYLPDDDEDVDDAPPLSNPFRRDAEEHTGRDAWWRSREEGETEDCALSGDDPPDDDDLPDDDLLVDEAVADEHLRRRSAAEQPSAAQGVDYLYPREEEQEEDPEAGQAYLAVEHECRYRAYEEEQRRSAAPDHRRQQRPDDDPEVEGFNEEMEEDAEDWLEDDDDELDSLYYGRSAAESGGQGATIRPEPLGGVTSARPVTPGSVQPAARSDPDWREALQGAEQLMLGAPAIEARVVAHASRARRMRHALARPAQSISLLSLDSSLAGVGIEEFAVGTTITLRAPEIAVGDLTTFTTACIARQDGKGATVAVTTTWPTAERASEVLAVMTRHWWAVRRLARHMSSTRTNIVVNSYASHAPVGGGAVLTYTVPIPGLDLLAETSRVLTLHEVALRDAATNFFPYPNFTAAPPDPAGRLSRDALAAPAPMELVAGWPTGARIEIHDASLSEDADDAPAAAPNLVSEALSAARTALADLVILGAPEAPVGFLVQDRLAVLGVYEGLALKNSESPAGMPRHTITRDERDLATTAWLTGIEAIRTDGDALLSYGATEVLALPVLRERSSLRFQMLVIPTTTAGLDVAFEATLRLGAEVAGVMATAGFLTSRALREAPD